jgi:hypothetical protein
MYRQQELAKKMMGTVAKGVGGMILKAAGNAAKQAAKQAASNAVNNVSAMIGGLFGSKKSKKS